VTGWLAAPLPDWLVGLLMVAAFYIGAVGCNLWDGFGWRSWRAFWLPKGTRP
jgi:hypothetical protein